MSKTRAASSLRRTAFHPYSYSGSLRTVAGSQERAVIVVWLQTRMIITDSGPPGLIQYAERKRGRMIFVQTIDPLVG